MIDLKTLKAGDTVKFRCGGEVVVRAINEAGHRSFNHGLRFIGQADSMNYNNSGLCGGSNDSGNSPFDIVEIIPAPFDFNYIRWGMAFTHNTFPLIHYIGRSKDGDYIFDFGGGHNCQYDGMQIENLIRIPERDISNE